MVSPSLDETSMAGTVVNIDPAGLLLSLSQLAAAPGTPADALKQALSSISFSQDSRKGTDQDIRKGTEARSETRKRSQDQTKWACEQCSKSYSNKANLKRHVNSAHAKRQRLLDTDLYECDDCDFAYASQAALDAHMDTHASTSKSPKHKCAFCPRERTSIYVHYCSHHKIDCPEEVMFECGNVLVISDIDTDGGKAAWFLREREKMQSYKDVICRFCETKFDNAEYLATHYTMYHMVDPAMLDNIKYVFRAAKGAHLKDLPPSFTPKRRPTTVSGVKEKNPVQIDGKETKKKEETKLKTPVETETRVLYGCTQCNACFHTEVLLDKHNDEEHCPKPTAKKPVCTLCNKEVVQIYKHYGNVHNIEYPEQMLFKSGNVLVLTDIDTKMGTAPWFLSEREKEGKYSLSTCRLCDIEYGNIDLLVTHYISDHKVRAEVLEKLDNLRCLFRAEKGAHLVDLPASNAKKQKLPQNAARPAKTESKSNAVKSDQIAASADKTGSDQSAQGLVMYQCADCSIAATTCDASIEHAQLHHLPDYHPIPQTCDICSFAFETDCFADHALHHLSRNEYKIVKFYPSKLFEEWSEMFQGLSESHANRIKESSLYQYTRRVKMNPDSSGGIAMYRCDKCELYVRPRDVEAHCYSKTGCVDKQGHFCSDCDIYFTTSVGLTDHEKHHRYGVYCFRRVTFNCREDELVNRALYNAKADPVAQGRNKPAINVIDNVLVSKWCLECRKSIVYSEYKTHEAMHKDKSPEHNISSDNDATEEQESSNSNKDDNSGHNELSLQDVETGNVEDTVETWNSDNDSCNSLLVATYSVDVDVHDQSAENAEADATNHNKTDGTEAEMDEVFSSPPDISGVFSETMQNDLRRDIEHLGLSELGGAMNQWAYIPDDLGNNILGIDNYTMRSSNYSESSDDKEGIVRLSQNSGSYANMAATGNDRQRRDRNETREDIDKINNNTDFNASKVRNGGIHGGNAANTKNDAQNDMELDVRPSSRDIIFRMLSDDGVKK